MKKGYIFIIVIIIIAVILGIIINANKENKTNTNNETNTKENIKKQEQKKDHGKVLVVYYSAQNHTKKVAQQIAQNLNADTFEIQPEEKYTEKDLDWTDDSSRVNKEHNDESLRNIKLKNTTVPNWDEYNTILIGYPIWWGIAAWPVNTFVKNNNFTGKTVYTFCTSVSSGLGESTSLLEKETNTGTWQDGQRFSSNPSNDEIKEFTDRI